MHPAPSLAEAPPKSDEPRASQQPQQQQPASPGSPRESHHESLGSHAESASPPMRKDTNSSTSTTATIATLATIATSASNLSNETAATGYSLQASPSFPSQAVFSVKDGADVAANRRATRRRTGPLSALQRERAALIRKLGACSDCRRRRVACHPNHHNMTWEEAARKYRSHSPSTHDLSGGRPLSPAPLNPKPLAHDSQDMDIDSPPSQQAPGRPPLSEARIRTPLPSGPRLDKPASFTPVPGIEHIRTDLQGTANRVLSDPYRSRYVAVQALLVHWQEDTHPEVRDAMNEFGSVLEQCYHYTFDIKAIPPASSEGCKNSWRWLSREITDFMDKRDQRDVLKIVYYTGNTYLDGNREMVLASSKNADSTSAIRWSGLQQILEEARSDTLIIMDAAYYPSSKLVRQQGVLELIAASASEDHLQFFDRSIFTRALTEQLRNRASQKYTEPLSAAELHAKLLSLYPKMIQDRTPETKVLTSFPSPLHMQMSGNARLPSVLLAPVVRNMPLGIESPQNGIQMTFTFKLADESISLENWAEWLRNLPEEIKEVRVEGPYRNTFR
ncbi:hypothetical protein GQ53DRAFT_309072 [Thozetella sp. PMI_491]|nr:hypothetical protein GQ53DRAFT_309072 [Thozetella sp. PMI_491]